MMQATTVIVSGLLMMATAETSIRIDGRVVEMHPPPVVQGGVAFVRLDAFAKAIGMEGKVVVEHRLVVLCNDVICIPVRLKPGFVWSDDGTARISLRLLAEAAGYAVSIDASGIEIVKKPVVAAKLAEGSMLPDVVLADLAGRPVHTADFLGKRILICTWASW